MKSLRQKEYAKLKQLSQSKGLCLRECGRKPRPNRLTCLVCANKEAEYSRKNEVARASASLKNRYGITLVDKKHMFKKQKGRCRVCGLRLPGVRRSHTDHDHESGKVRALLHRRCNIIVGYIENELHEKALRYLNSF